jgi:lipoate-protein ligase A
MGLATDDALAASVAARKAPPTLHLYSYVPSVIVGRYQNVAASLRLDRCEAHGIEVNRRTTGGGTVFMTPDQVAFGLFLPNDFPGLPRSIRGCFEFLAKAFALALREFGLEAEFEGRNDLAVDGKKIAGLAISQDLDGVTYFHTSLLLDFDLALMLDILNLPTRKMLDKGISCFGQRMTTVRHEAGREISLAEAQEAVHRAVEEYLSMLFPVEDLTDAEKSCIRDLLREKYENEEWIYGIRTPKGRMAFAERTTPGGLIQVHLGLSGGAIDTILITGDYFSRTRDIAKLESMLKYVRADRKRLEEKIREIKASEFIHRVDLPVILDLIEEATTVPSPSGRGAG